MVEQLDKYPNSEALEDYMERFEIQSMTKKCVKYDSIVAHLLTFIGKDAQRLINNLASPDKHV